MTLLEKLKSMSIGHYLDATECVEDYYRPVRNTMFHIIKNDFHSFSWIFDYNRDSGNFNIADCNSELWLETSFIELTPQEFEDELIFNKLG